MATITCSTCGTENPDDRTVCQECGGKIQRALHKPDEVKDRESQARPVSGKVARALGIIFGVMLLLPACLAIALTLFATPEVRPFEQYYDLGDAGFIGLVAAVASALIAAGIPLILWGRVNVMYFANAVFLALVSLYAHPWSTFTDTRSYGPLLPIMAAFPCLGALVFGILSTRGTRSKTVMRIASWILIVIGGLGTHRVVFVGLAKIFAPYIPGSGRVYIVLGGEYGTSYIALGADIMAGLLAGIIPLVLGRSKMSVMCFVNAVLLAVTTLCVYIWGFHTSRFTLTLRGLFALLPSRLGAVLFDILWGFHIGHLTLPGLFALLPSLGAVLFGILCARKTQHRGLRIISWICVGIGGLGTILFVVAALVSLFT
jgi:hypothetical protein